MGLKEERKRKKRSTSTTWWTPSTSSTSSMVSPKRVVLISWISLQMPNLWFLVKAWRFLTGGGSIICRVSSRDLYLAQSPSHPMDYPLIHLLGNIARGSPWEANLSLDEEACIRSWIFKLDVMEALKSQSYVPNLNLKIYSLFSHIFGLIPNP